MVACTTYSTFVSTHHWCFSLLICIDLAYSMCVSQLTYLPLSAGPWQVFFTHWFKYCSEPIMCTIHCAGTGDTDKLYNPCIWNQRWFPHLWKCQGWGTPLTMPAVGWIFMSGAQKRVTTSEIGLEVFCLQGEGDASRRDEQATGTHTIGQLTEMQETKINCSCATTYIGMVCTQPK